MAFKDALGDRMKEYENITRFSLPKRTYTIIRVDGKSFSKFTKGMERPFDDKLIDLMNYTAKTLCESIQGAKLGYVQSDEITILIYNEEYTAEDWFKGVLQKMCSISAAIATSAFTRALLASDFPDHIKSRNTLFDSRVFTISTKEEVHNCFLWRQLDATRNSVQSCGQQWIGKSKLHGVKTSGIKKLLKELNEDNKDWDKLHTKYKVGRAIVKQTVTLNGPNGEYIRNQWIIDEEMPLLTENKNYIFK